MKIKEAYPTGFSMEEFQNIRSFAGKKKYADLHLKRLSSGSSRIVYQVDNEKVLKIAKNKKGLAQNSIEGDWSIQQHDIAAKVYEIDEDNPHPFWVEMELAIPLARNRKRFEKLIGANQEDLHYYLMDVNTRLTGKGWYEAPRSLKEKMEENEWVQELVSLAVNYDMPVPGDLDRLSSYGEVKRNGKSVAVLIDFGLTRGVYTEYYS
jgi:hypothetical protein